ncbi:unnamed protein product, partial [Ectocarpus fasciculatus]
MGAQLPPVTSVTGGSVVSSTHSPSGSKSDPRAPVATGWVPTPAESVILNKWFAELDSDHTGFISGATAVGFLKRSNLPREILRDIWALVDSQNRGSIDNQQFYKVMRLVAI